MATEVAVGMTGKERTELAKLCRQRERVAKTMAAQRASELLADFERQLATEYSWDQEETWAEARMIAEEATHGANAMIAERCGELGIPAEFAPGLSSSWYGRGENQTAQRRAELRRVAQTSIDALTKAARTEIESVSLRTQTALLAGGLTTEDARAFLESMPSAESLMPRLAVAEVKRALLGPGSGR